MAGGDGDAGVDCRSLVHGWSQEKANDVDTSGHGECVSLFAENTSKGSSHGQGKRTPKPIVIFKELDATTSL